MVQEEMVKFRGLLSKLENEPVNFVGKFNLPILSALWRVTVGENLEYDDPVLVDIVTRLAEWNERIARPEAVILISLLWITKYWPTFLGRDKDIKIMRDMKKLMR